MAGGTAVVDVSSSVRFGDLGVSVFLLPLAWLGRILFRGWGFGAEGCGSTAFKVLGLPGFGFPAAKRKTA